MGRCVVGNPKGKPIQLLCRNKHWLSISGSLLEETVCVALAIPHYRQDAVTFVLCKLPCKEAMWWASGLQLSRNPSIPNKASLLCATTLLTLSLPL